MWNIDDIKKKREMYERKIEDILKEFEKEFDQTLNKKITRRIRLFEKKYKN